MLKYLWHCIMAWIYAKKHGKEILKENLDMMGFYYKSYDAHREAAFTIRHNVMFNKK